MVVVFGCRAGRAGSRLGCVNLVRNPFPANETLGERDLAPQPSAGINPSPVVCGLLCPLPPALGQQHLVHQHLHNVR